jgi:hypothetical protein
MYSRIFPPNPTFALSLQAQSPTEIAIESGSLTEVPIAPAPEPASLILLGTGAATLLSVSRFRSMCDRA